MPTISVKDGSGADVSIEAPLPPGRSSAAASKPVALSDEDLSALNAIATAVSEPIIAKNFFAIAPANSDLATRPQNLLVSVAGDLVMSGTDGVSVTVAVIAGQQLAVSPLQVRTGTTATVIGLTV